MKLKARAGTIFRTFRAPEKVIKVSFKTIYAFNSAMMASFLQVIVSKKNKQTEKIVAFIAVP